MLASSSNRSASCKRAMSVTVRPPRFALRIDQWLRAKPATCGKWVTQMT